MEAGNQHCLLFTDGSTIELLHDFLSCSLILTVHPGIVKLLVCSFDRNLNWSPHLAQKVRELLSTEVLGNVAHLDSHTLSCRS